jgi:hypothetical protein
MILPELKATAEAVLRIRSWGKEKKLAEQRRALWKMLSDLRPNQLISASGLFEHFDWQVESPQFKDTDEVEDVLRSMSNDGVEYSMSPKGWRIKAKSFGPRW